MISVQPANRSNTIPSVTVDASAPVGGAADGAGPALLPEPPASGLGDDAMTQLAMLITQADKQDRRAARGLQQAADRASAQETNERVQALRDKAEADGSSALWSGVGDIVSGTCAALGAIAGGTSNGSAGDAGSATCPAKPASGFTFATLLGGLSKGASAIVTFEAGSLKAEGDNFEADAVKHQALSEAAVRRYDEAHGEVQAADASIEKVQQFLQQTLAAENAARSAATGGRA